ncbi:hypothetical protein Cadr_000026006 [Camelus dromedarius]|uniref:Uncharacterized protein n=1 Tax=Camelus dromedarius TaxID=9838 RepID=A0A5N4CEP5_CAMDR|nr:hypothetical protein Cadr_000026006 [Camelus dromedarius]
MPWSSEQPLPGSGQAQGPFHVAGAHGSVGKAKETCTFLFAVSAPDPAPSPRAGTRFQFLPVPASTPCFFIFEVTATALVLENQHLVVVFLCTSRTTSGVEHPSPEDVGDLSSCRSLPGGSGSGVVVDAHCLSFNTCSGEGAAEPSGTRFAGPKAQRPTGHQGAGLSVISSIE